ncbi:hypothetical protein ABW20_dc0102065 [Dactylellina cionopaga]|nr:hypothetical protein ABW20_dc0102065 [Dactylellina cionopaga]
MESQTPRGAAPENPQNIERSKVVTLKFVNKELLRLFDSNIPAQQNLPPASKTMKRRQYRFQNWQQIKEMRTIASQALFSIVGLDIACDDVHVSLKPVVKPPHKYTWSLDDGRIAASEKYTEAIKWTLQYKLKDRKASRPCHWSAENIEILAELIRIGILQPINLSNPTRRSSSTATVSLDDAGGEPSRIRDRDSDSMDIEDGIDGLSYSENYAQSSIDSDYNGEEEGEVYDTLFQPSDSHPPIRSTRSKRKQAMFPGSFRAASIELGEDDLEYIFHDHDTSTPTQTSPSENVSTPYTAWSHDIEGDASNEFNLLEDPEKLPQELNVLLDVSEKMKKQLEEEKRTNEELRVKVDKYHDMVDQLYHQREISNQEIARLTTEKDTARSKLEKYKQMYQESVLIVEKIKQSYRDNDH